MRKNYYYIAPIELWRGFMEEPDKILNDVLAFETAAYSTKEQAEELHKRCRVHTYGSFYIADLLND